MEYYSSVKKIRLCICSYVAGSREYVLSGLLERYQQAQEGNNKD